MKKVLIALIPIVTIGACSWLPFVLLKERGKTWIYVAGTFVYVLLLGLVDGHSRWAGLAGLYTVALVASASMFAFVDAYRAEKDAERAEWREQARRHQGK